MSTIVERVTDLVAPILSDLGVSLYDLEHNGGVLKVVVDRPGGIDLDALAEITRNVSRSLDRADPMPGRYTLEVTSPGLERNLRTPAHFAGAVGSEVSVRTQPTAPGERRVHGTLAAADDEGVTVRQRETGEERRLCYGDIERARTVFEWGPGPKPGGQPKTVKRARVSNEEAGV